MRAFSVLVFSLLLGSCGDFSNSENTLESNKQQSTYSHAQFKAELAKIEKDHKEKYHSLRVNGKDTEKLEKRTAMQRLEVVAKYLHSIEFTEKKFQKELLLKELEIAKLLSLKIGRENREKYLGVKDYFYDFNVLGLDFKSVRFGAGLPCCSGYPQDPKIFQRSGMKYNETVDHDQGVSFFISKKALNKKQNPEFPVVDAVYPLLGVPNHEKNSIYINILGNGRLKVRIGMEGQGVLKEDRILELIIGNDSKIEKLSSVKMEKKVKNSDAIEETPPPPGRGKRVPPPPPGNG